MTINNLTEFVRSEGFKKLVEKQDHGIRFGFNLEFTECITKEHELKLYELDCTPAINRGEKICSGPVLTNNGKFIPLMVGTDDLAFRLFSMKEGTESRLGSIETDESIRRRSGSLDILHERLRERNFIKNKFEHALLNLNNTINKIGKGEYEFKRMEIYQGNVY